MLVVNIPFTFTVLQILLFEDRFALQPTQQVAWPEKVKQFNKTWAIVFFSDVIFFNWLNNWLNALFLLGLLGTSFSVNWQFYYSPSNCDCTEKCFPIRISFLYMKNFTDSHVHIYQDFFWIKPPFSLKGW